MTGKLTNRAALALLEDIEARRLANEELAAKATATIDSAVFRNREEAWRTALRLVAHALPAIIDEAARSPDPPWTELRLVYGDR